MAFCERSDNMIHRSVYLVLIVYFLLALTTGCQATTDVTEQIPTDLPVLQLTTPASSSTPESTDTQAPTATQVPTATPMPPTPTITPSPAAPITSIDDIIGTWLAYWSDQTKLNVEFKNTNQMIVSWNQDGTIISSNSFNIENGVINFTSTYSLTGSPVCKDAQGAYKSYIIRQGDQPISLSFELVGDDACLDRIDLLDGETLKWIKP
jgi:hypothetical protein